jgi:hypothetical protein
VDTTLFRKLYPELVRWSLFKKALKPDSQFEGKIAEKRGCAHKGSAMDRNESWHTADTEQVANGPLPHHDDAHRTEHSLPEKQKALYEEVDRLRLEVERLREQQQALQRTPQSNDTHVGGVADEQNDDARPKDPADRGRVRRPARLILALAVAALLCIGGLRFWNYLRSYESTDDAEIDGHLDPRSTRIDGTVVRVYVEDTYHVEKGQDAARCNFSPRLAYFF